MRIERLDLLAFGGFTDFVLDLSAGPKRLHILFGPNEAGKSTSLRAITGLLFGMETRTTDDFLHRKRDMRVGAKLVSDEKVLECVRRRGNKKTLLKPHGNEPADTTMLEQMLAGLDRDTFLTQFGLTHSALVEGGHAITQGSGDLGEILFAAGAGVSRLNAVKQRLEEQWKQLFLPTGSKPQLNAHFAELKNLRAALRDAQLLPSDYQRRQKSLAETEEEAERREKEAVARERKITRFKSYQEAYPLLARRDAVSKELLPLADVPRLDDDFVHCRRDADLALRGAKDRIEQLAEREKRLVEQLQALPQDDEVGSSGATISGLYEQLGAMRNAGRELPHFRSESRSLQDEIENILRDLQLPLDSDLETLRVPENTRGQLERLTAQEAKLRQRADYAANQGEKLQVEAERADHKLAALQKPTKGDALEAALRRAGNPQVLLQQLADTQETLARLEQRAQAKLSRLSGFQGTLEQAVALKPPLEATLRERADALQAAEKLLQRLAEKREEQEELRQRLQDELEAVQTQQAVPSEAELQQARTERDENVEALSQHLIAQQTEPALQRLGGLRGQIQTADATADRLRHDAERVAKRAETEAHHAAVARCLEDLASRKEKVMDDREHAKERWRELWRQVGVEAGTPAEMREWREEYQQLMQIYEDLVGTRTTHETVAESIDRAAQALTRALSAGAPVSAGSVAISAGQSSANDVGSDRQATLFAETDDDIPQAVPEDLQTLCDEAHKRLEQIRLAAQAYQDAAKDQQRIADSLRAAKTELRAVETEQEEWLSKWRKLCGKIDADPESRPDDVNRRIVRVTSLFDLSHQRDKVESKIEQLEADLTRYRQEAKETASRVAPECLVDDPLQTVERLMEILQKHRQYETKRQSVAEHLDHVREDREKAEQVVSSKTNELNRLCQEAGCETIDALPAIERQSAERAALEAKLRSIDEQLLLLAGGRDVESFLADVRQQDPAQTEQQIAMESRERDEQQAALKELRETLGTLRRDVRAMDGSDRAAGLQQQIQNVLVKIRRDAERYATLRVANVALHTAIDRYREANQGPVLLRAEQFFCRLTENAYEGLRAEFDEKGRPVLSGLRNGLLVPVQTMSEGTADALYLSLRLASLETHLQQRAPIPLVVDDILIQFDDRRAAAALSILAELSERTQIIFFTHHQHLIERAAQTLQPDEFHVHRLDQHAAK